MKLYSLTLLLFGICLLFSVHCFADQELPSDLDLPADLSKIDKNTLYCWAFFLSFITPLPWGPNITEEIKYFQLYSGHNINDLGEYTLCNNQPTQKYTVIEFASGIGRVGFCGPAFCDVKKMQRFSELLNHAVANLTAITKLSPDLEILNVVDPDEITTKEGSMFYVTIGVIGVLAVLVITGTAITNVTFLKELCRAKQEPKTMPTLNGLNGSLTDIVLAPDFTGSEVISSQSIETHFQNDYSHSKKSLKSSKPSMLEKIIKCFDLNKNIVELFKIEDTNPNHDQNLKVLNGVRALIFGWVVFGHVFLSSLTAKNIGYILPFMKKAVSLILIAAFFAVDTFFYLSGFFIGFILIEKLRTKRPGIKNYFAILLHRWIRLWPAYMVALLFFWKISVYMGSGPVWYNYVETAQMCDTQAWKNVLLLDNVLSEDFTECMPWAWYLACDFQIFLLTPFICWIYLKKRSRGLWVIWFLIGISIIAAYTYTADSGYTYLLMPKNGFKMDWMSGYYVNPLARMSPYLLGLWFGILFREFKNGNTNFLVHIKNSKLKSFSCLILGVALLNFLIFFPRDLQTGHTWSDGFAMTWGILSRPLWAIGIFMFTAPSLVGDFKSLTNFMGNRYFTVVSKLSYTGYLVHYIVIFGIFLNMTKLSGVSMGHQTLLSLSCLLVSCTFAVALHLLVEKPIINIEKVLMGRGKKKDKKIEDNDVVPKEI